MNDWHCFFDRIDDNLANSTYCIFEPRCKTEIFNWFSRADVAKEQKEDFIQALVDFSDDCGDFYRYRAYLLAAEAINYFKDCSRGDAIALQVLKWSYAFFRQDKQDWQIVPQPLVEAARLTLEVTDRQRVISAFTRLVHTTKSRTILHLAAEKLGKLDPGNKSAIAALVLLLEVTQDESAIWDINCNLMQIAPDNLAVISTLDKLAAHNTDGCSDLDRCWYLISHAAIPSGKVDSRNKTAIEALVQLMQTTTARGDIEWAIKKLEAIATGNETAINALIKLIQTTNDKYICGDAISSLGKIAIGSQTAIAALTKFLQINQGDYICFDTAKALWQIDEGNANAIATLVQIVAVDRRIWNDAADHLLEIDPKNVDVISALTERVTATDEYSCCNAAIRLLKFEPDNELAIAILSQILQSSDFIDLRQRAADSLLEIDPSNQAAIDTLFALIKYLGQSPPDPHYVSYVAWDAILALQKIDPSNQLAIAALVNLLNTAQKESNLYIAVGCLGHFAAGNKDAIAALTKIIDSIKDDGFLCHTAYRLGSIDPGNQKALSAMIEFIRTFNELDTIYSFAEDGRSHGNSQLLDVASNLQEILPTNQMPQVVVALKDYLSKSKQDSSYRYEACYNLIWHCAQNMTYPDFYKAWHTS